MIPRIITEPAETLALFGAGCEWAERISLCFARADTQKGASTSWRVLAGNLNKVDSAVVNLDGRAAEPSLLRRLDDRGVLRVAPGDPGLMNANVYAFWNGFDARVLVGSVDFTSSALERAVCATVFAQGSTDHDFFCGVRRLLERCRGLARLPTRADIEAYERTFSRGDSVLPPPPTSLANYVVRGHLVLLTGRKEIDDAAWRLASTLGIERKEGWGSTTERRSGMRGGQSSMRNVQAA